MFNFNSNNTTQPFTFGGINPQPNAFNAQPNAFNAQPNAFNAQPIAFNAQPNAFNTQPTTAFNPSAFNTQPTTAFNPSAFNAQPTSAFNPTIISQVKVYEPSQIPSTISSIITQQMIHPLSKVLTIGNWVFNVVFASSEALVMPYRIESGSHLEAYDEVLKWVIQECLTVAKKSNISILQLSDMVTVHIYSPIKINNKDIAVGSPVTIGKDDFGFKLPDVAQHVTHKGASFSSITKGLIHHKLKLKFDANETCTNKDISFDSNATFSSANKPELVMTKTQGVYTGFGKCF